MTTGNWMHTASERLISSSSSSDTTAFTCTPSNIKQTRIENQRWEYCMLAKALNAKVAPKGTTGVRAGGPYRWRALRARADTWGRLDTPPAAASGTESAAVCRSSPSPAHAASRCSRLRHVSIIGNECSLFRYCNTGRENCSSVRERNERRALGLNVMLIEAFVPRANAHGVGAVPGQPLTTTSTSEASFEPAAQ